MISSMKGLISSVFENRRRNGVFNLGLIPGHTPDTITINVYHGQTPYEVVVPSNSNFGYVKSIVSQGIGVKPEMCKIIFGGVEREDSEVLREAGVMNNLGVLLKVMENDEKIPEVVHETSVISKGEDAVAEVRKEVDKLAHQVFELEVVVDSGNKVDDKTIAYLSEMLMRQLLTLDGIEAEGEGRNQRRMEVRRVQRIVESLDVLKSRNKSFVKDTQSRAPRQSAHTPSPMASSSPTPQPHIVPPTTTCSAFAAVDFHFFSAADSTPSFAPTHDPSQISFHTTPTRTSVPYNDPNHMPASSLMTRFWEHFN